MGKGIAFDFTDLYTIPDANEVNRFQIHVCEVHVEPLRFAENIQSLANDARD